MSLAKEVELCRSLSGGQTVLRRERHLSKPPAISSSEGLEVSEVQVASPSGFRPVREGDLLDNVGFVFFSDPDGNGWAVQRTSDRG